MNLLLYLVTVFIWGTTWLAIKFQLGPVSPEVSIFYRFVIATSVLLFFCKAKRISLKFTLKEHVALLLLAFLMFSIHFIFVYKASLYLVSGLVSVIFSLVSIFNIVNAYFFFKKKPENSVILGACLGIIGICIFFRQELLSFSFQSKMLLGTGFALMAALLFSFGNSLSKRNQKQGIAIIPSTTIAMVYGCCIMLVYILTQNLSFTFPTRLSYWYSLLYLAIPGSVIGFLCYLNLIYRIGPDRAGYATIFFPVVALTLSFFAENYHWKITDFIAIAFILIGNCLVILKKRPSEQRL